MSLSRKLSSARTFDTLITACRGGFACLCGLAVVLMVVFWIDYRAMHLSAGLRGLAWIAVLGMLVWLAMRFLIKPLQVPRSDDGIALRVESIFPPLGGRLIAAVQLSRSMDQWARKGAGRIVESIQEQAEALSQPMRFSNITPLKPLRNTIACFGVVSVVWALTWSSQKEACSTFLDRMLFGDAAYPSLTKIVRVEPGDSTNPFLVVRGAPVPFSTSFAGIWIPSEAKLEIIDDRNRTTTLDMESEGGGRFSVSLPRVSESFSYRAFGGDTFAENDHRGRKYRVEMRLRPVASVSLALTYPPYTGYAPRQVEGGTAKVLEGTAVTVRIQSSKPIRMARLRYLSGSDKGKEIPMAIDGNDPQSGTVVLPGELARGFRYTIQVRDTQGISNYDDILSKENPAPVYSIRVVPDRRPHVAVIEPPSDTIEVKEDSRVDVKAKAADDFGIIRAALRWKPVRAEYAEEGGRDEKWRIESLYDAGARAASQKLEDLNYTFVPKNLGAAAGDSIVFFVEARDNTSTSDFNAKLEERKLPRGIGRSKEYTIVIIDEKTFNKRMKKRMESLSEKLLNLTKDWDELHREIGQEKEK